MFKKSNLVLGILFCLFLFNFAWAFELTEEQILSVQNNGMITAICFVTDIVTGAFARGIFTLSVIALGWLFVIGEVKDHKPVFLFVLSVSITIGAANIANVFTGNDYSCAKFKQIIEKNEGEIVNKGNCVISELDYYAPQQVWKICDTENNINTCNREVNSETSITYSGRNRIVTLYSCQDGYFKDDVNSYLFFRCDVAGFTPLFAGADQAGECKKACTYSNLVSLANSYYVNINSFEELSNTGRKEDGKYYTQGFQLKANCRDGYFEYNSNSEPDNDGIVFTCGKNATFTIEGSCKKNCSIKSTSFYNSVDTWKKCGEDGNCVQTSETEFSFGTVLEIDNCRSGYLLSEKKEGNARIQCGNNGNWSIVYNESGDYGNQCIKKCDIREIENYQYSTLVEYCDGVACSDTATTKNLFEDGDKLLIKECVNGNSFDYQKTNGVLTCNSSGKWSLEEGTSYCNFNCKFADLYGREGSQMYQYCNSYGEDCKTFDVLSENVPTGALIRLKSCQDGYSYNTGNSTIYAICRNGKYLYSNKNNICRLNCKNTELFTPYSNFVSSWKEVNDNNDFIIDGNIISSATSGDTSINNTYYVIENCRTGYYLPSGGTLVAMCYNSQWKILGKTDYVCMPKCQNSKLFAMLPNATSFVESNSSGYVLGQSNTITDPNGETNPGQYYIINTCQDGFKIFNNRSIVVKCFNGEWNVHLNKNNVCVK